MVGNVSRPSPFSQSSSSKEPTSAITPPKGGKITATRKGKILEVRFNSDPTDSASPLKTLKIHLTKEMEEVFKHEEKQHPNSRLKYILADSAVRTYRCEREAISEDKLAISSFHIEGHRGAWKFTIREEKTGFFNAFKRALGIGGYEYEYETKKMTESLPADELKELANNDDQVIRTTAFEVIAAKASSTNPRERKAAIETLGQLAISIHQSTREDALQCLGKLLQNKLSPVALDMVLKELRGVATRREDMKDMVLNVLKSNLIDPENQGLINESIDIIENQNTYINSLQMNSNEEIEIKHLKSPVFVNHLKQIAGNPNASDAEKQLLDRTMQKLLDESEINPNSTLPMEVSEQILQGVRGRSDDNINGITDKIFVIARRYFDNQVLVNKNPDSLFAIPAGKQQERVGVREAEASEKFRKLGLEKKYDVNNIKVDMTIVDANVYGPDATRVSTHQKTPVYPANYVSAGGDNKSIIAATPPKRDEDVADYLATIIGAGSNLVVRLATQHEVTFKKETTFVSYIPQEINQEITFSDQSGKNYKVKLLSSEKRSLEGDDPLQYAVVKKVEVTTPSGETKEITVLDYNGWPDRSSPDLKSLENFMNLSKKLNPTHSDGSSSPEVVHCSSGVGRTGVYACLKALPKEASIDQIQTAINKIRVERNAEMVQSPSQMALIFALLNNSNRITDTVKEASRNEDHHKILHMPEESYERISQEIDFRFTEKNKQTSEIKLLRKDGAILEPLKKVIEEKDIISIANHLTGAAVTALGNLMKKNCTLEEFKNAAQLNKPILEKFGLVNVDPVNILLYHQECSMEIIAQMEVKNVIQYGDKTYVIDQNNPVFGGTLTYPEGSERRTWTGPVDKNGEPYGQGTIVFIDDSTFVGNVDTMTGSVTNLDFRGNEYTGPVADTRPHGKNGIMVIEGRKIMADFEEGEIVEGTEKEYVENLKVDGREYTGSMANGIPYKFHRPFFIRLLQKEQPLTPEQEKRQIYLAIKELKKPHEYDKMKNPVKRSLFWKLVVDIDTRQTQNDPTLTSFQKNFLKEFKEQILSGSEELKAKFDQYKSDMDAIKLKETTQKKYDPNKQSIRFSEGLLEGTSEKTRLPLRKHPAEIKPLSSLVNPRYPEDNPVASKDFVPSLEKKLGTFKISLSLYDQEKEVVAHVIQQLLLELPQKDIKTQEDLKRVLKERVKEKSRSVQVLDRETLDAVYQTDLPLNLSKLPENKEVIQAYKDGSWKDGEERTIVFIDIRDQSLNTLIRENGVIDQLFSDDEFQQILDQALKADLLKKGISMTEERGMMTLSQKVNGKKITVVGNLVNMKELALKLGRELKPSLAEKVKTSKAFSPIKGIKDSYTYYRRGASYPTKLKAALFSNTSAEEKVAIRKKINTIKERYESLTTDEAWQGKNYLFMQGYEKFKREGYNLEDLAVFVCLCTKNETIIPDDIFKNQTVSDLHNVDRLSPENIFDTFFKSKQHNDIDVRRYTPVQEKVFNNFKEGALDLVGEVVTKKEFKEGLAGIPSLFQETLKKPGTTQEYQIDGQNHTFDESFYKDNIDRNFPFQIIPFGTTPEDIAAKRAEILENKRKVQEEDDQEAKKVFIKDAIESVQSAAGGNESRQHAIERLCSQEFQNILSGAFVGNINGHMLDALEPLIDEFKQQSSENGTVQIEARVTSPFTTIQIKEDGTMQVTIEGDIDLVCSASEADEKSLLAEKIIKRTTTFDVKIDDNGNYHVTNLKIDEKYSLSNDVYSSEIQGTNYRTKESMTIEYVWNTKQDFILASVKGKVPPESFRVNLHPNLKDRLIKMEPAERENLLKEMLIGYENNGKIIGNKSALSLYVHQTEERKLKESDRPPITAYLAKRNDLDSVICDDEPPLTIAPQNPDKYQRVLDERLKEIDNAITSYNKKPSSKLHQDIVIRLDDIINLLEDAEEQGVAKLSIPLGSKKVTDTPANLKARIYSDNKYGALLPPRL